MHLVKEADAQGNLNYKGKKNFFSPAEYISQDSRTKLNVPKLLKNLKPLDDMTSTRFELYRP
jgi:hypothetical protein